MQAAANDLMSQKAEDVAEKELMVLDESSMVAEAAKVMKERQVSSVLVAASKRTGSKIPVGIVTEKDILYRVVAENKGPFKVTLRDIMSSPLITVDGEAPVRDAIAIMRKEKIRRVLVVAKSGEAAGMLTLRSIVGNGASSKIDLAEVEQPAKAQKAAKIVCPYCQSAFEDKETLSKHIDRLHLGAGLLEGDMRQW